MVKATIITSDTLCTKWRVGASQPSHVNGLFVTGTVHTVMLILHACMLIALLLPQPTIQHH